MAAGRRATKSWFIAITVVLCIAALASVYKAAERAFSPPPRGFHGVGDLSGQLTADCAEKALHLTFGDAIMAYWAESIGGELPSGTAELTVSYYQTPDERGAASLAIGDVAGHTRVSHNFMGWGDPLPQEDFTLGLAAMHRAEAALKTRCDADLSGLKWREIGQHIDALH